MCFERIHAACNPFLKANARQAPAYLAQGLTLTTNLQDALNNISYMGILDLPVSEMDLRCAALDLAVRSKQLACAQVLRPGVHDLSGSFLVAAAESGCSRMLQWALQTWCSQFNCIHGFGPCCLEDLHAALR
jgi:hypothetical protein